jgi:hypothetical protein
VGSCEHCNQPSGSINDGELLDYLSVSVSRSVLSGVPAQNRSPDTVLSHFADLFQFINNESKDRPADTHRMKVFEI